MAKKYKMEVSKNCDLCAGRDLKHGNMRICEAHARKYERWLEQQKPLSSKNQKCKECASKNQSKTAYPCRDCLSDLTRPFFEEEKMIDTFTAPEEG